MLCHQLFIFDMTFGVRRQCLQSLYAKSKLTQFKKEKTKMVAGSVGFRCNTINNGVKNAKRGQKSSLKVQSKPTSRASSRGVSTRGSRNQSAKASVRSTPRIKAKSIKSTFKLRITN